MTIYIPGRTDVESPNRFDWDATDGIVSSGQRPTVAAGIWRFFLRGDATITGDTTYRLAGPSPDGTSDFGLQTQIGTAGATNFNVRCRTQLVNSHNSTQVPVPVDTEMYLGVKINFLTLELKFYDASGQLGDTIALTEGDTWRSSTWRPLLRGRSADGKDIEFEEVVYWHNANDLSGDASAYVPTDAQMLSYVPGADISTWPTPKSHMKPTGANGVIATTIPDLAPGGRVFNLTTGDTSGKFAPYFVSGESPILSLPTATTTARSASIGFASSENTGTAYIVGAPTGSFSVAPDPADIEAGVLDDGTTPATYADSFDMTGETSGVFSIDNMPANSVADFYVVQNIDDSGEYSNVLHIPATTKRPVVVPSGADKRLLDGGDPVVSETGMTMWVLGTEYSQAGYATDSAGLFELDLTEYLNTTGTEDIGDTVDIVLTLVDGERGIVAMGQTITEGD